MGDCNCDNITGVMASGVRSDIVPSENDERLDFDWVELVVELPILRYTLVDGKSEADVSFESVEISAITESGDERTLPIPFFTTSSFRASSILVFFFVLCEMKFASQFFVLLLSYAKHMHSHHVEQ